MSFAVLAHLIETYRYWIFIPLAFLEGPIVSFVAGTLASVGYLNIPLALLVLFGRDIIVDSASYFLGRFAEHLAVTRWLLGKLGVSGAMIDDVRRQWNEHGARTMFVSKLSYGVSAAFLVVAGMVEMPFRNFLKYAALVAVTQYGILFFLGYFFGIQFGSLYAILDNIQFVIAGIGLFAAAYYLLRSYLRRRMLAADSHT
ncbi:MAG: VTT domain-containing protein [Patescibacteria group bacterium]|nr:VTT domain-containing protein [Patescibacteria group bacterium]